MYVLTCGQSIAIDFYNGSNSTFIEQPQFILYMFGISLRLSDTEPGSFNMYFISINE